LVGWLIIVGVRYVYVKDHNSEMLKLEVKTYLCTSVELWPNSVRNWEVCRTELV